MIRYPTERAAPIAPESHAWRADPVHGHGELATQHWLWGRHACALRIVDGRLVTRPAGWSALHLDFRIPGSPEDVNLAFRGRELVHLDITRRRILGELVSDRGAAPLALVARDLQVAGHDTAEPRRFTTVSGRLETDALPAIRHLWPRHVRGRYVDLFAHVEWTPAPAPPRAA